MPRDNWRYVYAAVGLLALSGLGYGGYQLYQAAEQHRPYYHYQPASEPGKLVFMPGKAPAQRYQPYCANPQSGEDADLCAQWAAVEQVAESNRIQSFNLRLAIASLWATIIATGLLVWNLIETRSTARRQLRAYVTVHKADIIGRRAGTIPFARLDILNEGQTPAYDVMTRCYLGWHVTGALEEWFEIEPVHEVTAVGTIGPHGSMTATPKLPSEWTDQMESRFKAGEIAIFVWGLLTYRDAFNRTRTTEFRYRHDRDCINTEVHHCARGNKET